MKNTVVQSPEAEPLLLSFHFADANSQIVAEHARTVLLAPARCFYVIVGPSRTGKTLLSRALAQLRKDKPSPRVGCSHLQRTLAGSLIEGGREGRVIERQLAWFDDVPWRTLDRRALEEFIASDTVAIRLLHSQRTDAVKNECAVLMTSCEEDVPGWLLPLAGVIRLTNRTEE